MKPRVSLCSSFLHGVPGVLLFLLLLLCRSWRAAAQAQLVPQTDPVEAAAVNAILSKLGLSAPTSWNISGNPCSGAATDDTPLDDNPVFNPAIKCDCSDQNNTLCHVIRLKINMLDAVGRIPEVLRNLTHLKKLTQLRRSTLSRFAMDDYGVPPWNERPRCYCGSRAKMNTSTKEETYGRRYWECPDVDPNWEACGFMQWIDNIALPIFPRPEWQLDYEVRMQEEESIERARLRHAEEELRRQNRTVIEQHTRRRRAVG